MATEWFHRSSGQESGPVDSRELRRLAEAGVVGPETLVRKGANGRWVRAEEVRGLFQRSTPAPSPSLGASPPPPLLPPPLPKRPDRRRGDSRENADWFFQIGDEVCGPVTDAKLLLKVYDGEIGRDTLVRKLNQEWTKAERLDLLADFFSSPKGVGGWLLFFCVSLTILGPVYGLGSMARGWVEAQFVFALFPSLQTALAWENAGSIALVVYGGVVGWTIWSGNPNGREIAKMYLLVRLFGFIGIEFIAVLLLGGLPSEVVASVIVAALGEVFWNSIWCLIWWFYFKKSKRVRNTYAKSRIKEFGEAMRTPPLPPPVAGSGGESPIRHGLGAAEVKEASEKPEPIWPVTWAAIIVGSGTALLLLWAMVFRGGSPPQQQAEKDQPPLAAAQSAESRASAPAPQAVEWTPPDDAVVWTPEVGKSLGIPPPPDWQDKTTPAAAPAAEPKSVPATGNVKILGLADLAELVGPSVVQVNVTGPEEGATGSGFVLDKQGTIVTNFHVIEDATAGRIVFSDRTSAPITGYLGAWPEKDIALVRVECPPDKLHPLRLATSPPRQGEQVAAFGSPLGLQQSVSEGIVSAVRESKELRALGPIDVNARLIQTTTPISHGNSGGPLVDMKGMVVGVNTWTFRPLGGENVNFAVAAAEVLPLLLAKNGTPSPLPANDPAANGARRILRRASDHMDAGDYDSAIADYTEAIRLDPENADAYLGRGWVYILKDDYDSAIADFSEAIRLDPKDAIAYEYRGNAYCRKRDYDSAIADCTKAIRLDPKDASAYLFRGYAYSRKDDIDSAIADYTEAIRLDPKNADAYEARALDYLSKGDIDSAIADYTEAIRLDPKDADLYYWRGFAYLVKRDSDSAIADLTDAIRLDPKHADAFYRRGVAYQKKGQRAAAERDFAQAERLGYKP